MSKSGFHTNATKVSELPEHPDCDQTVLLYSVMRQVVRVVRYVAGTGSWCWMEFGTTYEPDGAVVVLLPVTHEELTYDYDYFVCMSDIEDLTPTGMVSDSITPFILGDQYGSISNVAV